MTDSVGAQLGQEIPFPGLHQQHQ